MDQAGMFSNTQWNVFYKVAGTMALLIVLAGLTDGITSMGIEARDNSSIPVVEWFSLFQTDRFSAFSRLGVINIITLTLCIPIYLSYNRAFRQDHPALTALASSLYFIGTVVYLSSNTVFPLFGLSQQYALAPEAQKPMLEAAGQALLAQGADLTTGTFIGLFLTQIANIMITANMLRGNVFSKWTGWCGLAGFSLMSIFFILTAFVPGQYDTAMIIAMPGGLILIAYQIMLARRFFQLGR